MAVGEAGKYRCVLEMVEQQCAWLKVRTYQWKNGYYNRPGISKLQGIPGSSAVKNLSANAGDMGLISRSGRFPGEGNGKPLQYSCVGNPVDRGTWWPPVHGVEKSQT